MRVQQPATRFLQVATGGHKYLSSCTNKTIPAIPYESARA